jgi:aspartate--ammonia ligase
MFTQTWTESVSRLKLPEKQYSPYLNLRETETTIKFIKDRFQKKLARALNLQRISAPLMVPSNTGLNDNLNGVEKPVSFRTKDGSQLEIVQSLAKWKREALHRYGFAPGEGLYTDMNAIRPDEIVDNLHSVYVDQWDWERVITDQDRNLTFLKFIVRKIYGAIRDVERDVCERYPVLPPPFLPPTIHFVHSEELEQMYPDITPKEREDAIAKKFGAVFIIGIGYPLKNGLPHDGRAADYDDWITETKKGHHGLNGDIIVYYPPLDQAVELSSMGIRVSPQSLLKQLEFKGELYKTELPYHKSLLNGELPLTIGGGIGQSRLCMVYLRKIHIGEVQASTWPLEMVEICRRSGIPLL